MEEGGTCERFSVSVHQFSLARSQHHDTSHLCLSATPAISQVLYGSVVGAVKDAQGASVPGATVTIVNKDTNLTRETVTSADGTYSMRQRGAGSV